MIIYLACSLQIILKAAMVLIRGKSSTNKHSMGAAIHSASKQQHHPPSNFGRKSRLPLDIPPGTAASEYQQIFMDHCEFRPSPVHGYGVFAIQDIQPGTLIMKEKALWVVDTLTAINSTFCKDSDYSTPRQHMINSFYGSTIFEENEKERIRLQSDILTLCGGFGVDEVFGGDKDTGMQKMAEHLREILIRNGVTESCDGKPAYAAVFRASSRLNHSCAPNAERLRSKMSDGSVVSYPLESQPRLMSQPFPTLTL